MPQTPLDTVTTSFLLGNLHCPSCVALIQSLLEEAYGKQILWVSPNLITSVVTIQHRNSVSASSMEKSLEEVGFEICGVNSTCTTSVEELDEFNRRASGETNHEMQQSNGPFDALSQLWRAKRPMRLTEAAKHAHAENCQACQTIPTRKKDSLSSPRSSSSAVGHGEKLDPNSLQTVVVNSDPANSAARFKATISVGGMTCASCVNAVTDGLSGYPWISNVVVSLVSNSATVEYDDKDRTNDIAEAIEDLGYDATVDNVVDLEEQSKSRDWREVIIRVDGLFCNRCPDRICLTLKSFQSSHIEILREPSVEHPYVALRYIPQAPLFTIRHILRAIEAADPSFKASIYHPPTLEERSRAIRAKHQMELLGREVLTFLLAIPTFVLGIVYMSLVPQSDPTRTYLTKPWRSGLSRLDLILCLLATPVYFFAADIFHRRAYKEVRTMWRRNSRTPLLARFYKFGSMNMLMSLGTTIAYFSSVAQMIAAGASHDHDVSSGRFYFDSVVFLTLFLLAGRIIESYSKSKTGDAVDALSKLRPTTALLVETDKLQDQTTTTVGMDQLEFGDTIRVPQGTSPAADGVILTGESSFDESSLTGESRLIKKGEGDEVFAGTINKGPVVTIRITGTSGKSMLDQIVDVVREGQAKRAPMEHVADVLTTYFVPVITLVAIITWVVWMALVFSGAIPDASTASGQRIASAFEFAIAVFVVACPCGLGLAAPTAIFVGGSLAAKHGILAKGGGDAFEKASKIDCVVFDKTGTLTVGGEPQITDSVIMDSDKPGHMGKEALLSAVKALEENSSHPIAKAIVAFCGRDTKAAELDNVEEVSGRGMKANITESSHGIAIGNEQLMHELSVEISPDTLSTMETWKREAKSVALVAVKKHDANDWTLAAAFSISDPIRDDAVSVIQALQSNKIQVWMLSGDNVTTAQAVAKRVGIPPTNVLAEVLPSEKAAKISYLQATLHAGEGSGSNEEDTSRRAKVAMVGDGINDSPALTTADVGIAIGSGSDVAISSADFVLASSSLTSVLTLLELSRVVFRRIKLNFAWALVYNLLAVPIAAGCLYAVRTGSGGHVRLDPVWASLAMALSSISVVLSSLALKLKVPWLGFRPTKLAVQ